jgi:hypothetical protein
MKGTWQTTDGGGSGLAAALIVGAAVLAVAVAGPVAAAVAELVRVVVIIVAAAVVLALAAGAAFVAYRVRQRQVIGSGRVSQPRQVPWRTGRLVSAPRQQAIDAPREVHLHFHGVDADDVAEVLRQLPGDR